MKLFIGMITMTVLLSSCGYLDDITSTGSVDTESVVSTTTDNNTFAYLTYSKSATAQLEEEGSPYAVFWASKSCGTCAKKDAEIQNRINELPEGTAILRAEFEEASDEDLNTFGVVKYDTFTVFNADGEFETIRGASIDEVASKLAS